MPTDNLKRESTHLRVRDGKNLRSLWAWYYEERGGLTIVTDRPGDPIQYWIPIAQLRSFIERHDAD